MPSKIVNILIKRINRESS